MFAVGLGKKNMLIFEKDAEHSQSELMWKSRILPSPWIGPLSLSAVWCLFNIDVCSLHWCWMYSPSKVSRASKAPRNSRLWAFCSLPLESRRRDCDSQCDLCDSLWHCLIWMRVKENKPNFCRHQHASATLSQIVPKISLAKLNRAQEMSEDVTDRQRLVKRPASLAKTWNVAVVSGTLASWSL